MQKCSCVMQQRTQQQQRTLPTDTAADTVGADSLKPVVRAKMQLCDAAAHTTAAAHLARRYGCRHSGGRLLEAGHPQPRLRLELAVEQEARDFQPCRECCSAMCTVRGRCESAESAARGLLVRKNPISPARRARGNSQQLNCVRSDQSSSRNTDPAAATVENCTHKRPPRTARHAPPGGHNLNHQRAQQIPAI